MATPSKVDLYVAAGIAQFDGTHARIADLGVDLDSARAVRAEFNERFPSFLLPAADLVQFFGPPEEATPQRLRFGLALWPDHLAYYGSHAPGVVTGYPHFARRHPVQAGEVPVRSAAAAKAYFRPWHHTTQDLEALWGPPDRDESWAPHDSWYYRIDGGGELGLHFAHGLLIIVEAPDA